MRLSHRSYPHPVIGNQDDVPGVAFQAVVEMTTDKQFIFMSVEVACSCSVLDGLVKKGVEI